MHRQNGTIECAVCRLGRHRGDVVVHRVPIIQRPRSGCRHRRDLTALFWCRTRPVLFNLPCELVPFAKRMQALHPADRNIRISWVLLLPAFVCAEGFLPPTESFIPLVVLCDIILFARDEQSTPCCIRLL